MTYVEWLRVRGALKSTAIVLGIFFIIACVVRISVAGFDAMNHEMKFGYYIIAGSVIAMILATVLGAPFARENDGHLEVAFTKPVDRTALALRTIGIDIVGIIAALALGVVFSIAAHMVFYPPYITFHFDDVIALVIGIMAPLAWYAMLAAATASLKRGYAVILGIAWPVALLVAGLSLVDGRDNPMLALIHGTFWTLSRIDPLTYMHMESFQVANAHAMVFDPTWLARLTMLSVLALGYGALAVIQWRRVEA